MRLCAEPWRLCKASNDNDMFKRAVLYLTLALTCALILLVALNHKQMHSLLPLRQRAIEQPELQPMPMVPAPQLQEQEQVQEPLQECDSLRNTSGC